MAAIWDIGIASPAHHEGRTIRPWRLPVIQVNILGVTGVDPLRWISGILGWVYPDVCQACQTQAATSSNGYVCSNCRRAVHFIRPPFCERCGLPFEGNLTSPFECSNCSNLELHFDAARSAVLARGLVLQVLRRYKYQQAVWFEQFLADLLIHAAIPAVAACDWDLIMPVPLHPVREREREFNQAARLARHLSRATGIPVDRGCLQRTRPTQTQTLLTREQRLRNLRGAFALGSRTAVSGLSCVVVDDVLTTGATTSACARALKEGGARKVCVWTVARGV